MCCGIDLFLMCETYNSFGTLNSKFRCTICNDHMCYVRKCWEKMMYRRFHSKVVIHRSPRCPFFSLMKKNWAKKNTQQSFIWQIKTVSLQQERLHIMTPQQWVTGNTVRGTYKKGDLSSVISEVCHQRGYYTWREWRRGFGDNHDSLSPSLLSRKDGNGLGGLAASLVYWRLYGTKGNSQSWLLFFFSFFFFFFEGS